MSNTQSQAPALPPGALFLFPGISGQTEITENYDTNKDFTTSINPSSSKSVPGLIPFEQTTIVFMWELELSVSQDITVGTGQTVTTSPYFPYNIIKSINIDLQSTYPLYKNVQGIDMAILNAYRPWNRGKDRRNNLTTNPAQIWATNNFSQPSLQTNPGLSYTSTGFFLGIEIPASIIIDRYYELAIDGTPDVSSNRGVHTAIVSPQYMAASSRKVTPKIELNQGFGSDLQSAPFNTTTNTASGDTATTMTSSVTGNFRRVGVYDPPTELTAPPTYPWDYNFTVDEYALAGVAQYTVNLPPKGQLLSTYLRFWDPNANGGLGAPIPLTNIESIVVSTGAGLVRYNDTPRSAQKRFLDQHGFLPPVGVLVWDFAIDWAGKVTNATAINLLTTAGVKLEVIFTGNQSLTAVVYNGLELLQFTA